MSDASISVIVNFCEADERYLSRCMKAIEWQLSVNDELIVVKDTQEDPPIFLPHTCGTALPSWKGLTAARNTGARAATKRWLKFMDVDDVLAPFALEAFRKFEAPEWIKCVQGGQTTIYNGQFERDRPWQRHPKDASWWDGIERANPSLHSKTFVDRQEFRDVGGCDERIEFEEDWDLWLRLREKFGMSAFCGIPARICYYWIDEKERAAKKVCHEVTHDGVTMDVREYFRKRYGVNPAR